LATATKLAFKKAKQEKEDEEQQLQELKKVIL